MKKNLKFIVEIFISILFFGISFYFFQKGYDNFTQDIVKYEENNNIDYKVYLKENSYFDEPYLGENKVYITNLIDYIDVDLLYNFKMDEKRNGKYVYYIKGVMSANVSNTSKDFWQKKYDLTSPKEVKYHDVDEINFKENLKINYSEYNDILIQFKEDYKLAMDGSFKVVLCVENYIQGLSDYELKKVSTTSLEIPLTKATIEVPIKLDEINENGELASEPIYNDTISNIIYKIISVICLLIGIYLLAYAVFKIVRGLEKISSYNKELKKILKTYDGIIVNVSKLPNYNNSKIIDVNSFTELLDAHGEIRQPISYLENYKTATFTLINRDVVWRYILKDLDYEKK